MFKFSTVGGYCCCCSVRCGSYRRDLHKCVGHGDVGVFSCKCRQVLSDLHVLALRDPFFRRVEERRLVDVLHGHRHLVAAHGDCLTASDGHVPEASGAAVLHLTQLVGDLVQDADGHVLRGTVLVIQRLKKKKVK